MEIAMSQVQHTKVPAAVGPYRHTVEANGWVFASGQIPVNPETGVVITNDIREATRQALTNLAAVLGEEGLTLSNVVKTTVFVVNLQDFAAVNEVYTEFFRAPYPARACVQVSALPKAAPIEIEAIAVRSCASRV
jgi:2-iminobutanoate/2-iminopropanoate deaminase